MLSIIALSFRKPRRLFLLSESCAYLVQRSDFSTLTSKAVGVPRTPHCHILSESWNSKTKIGTENEFISLLYIKKNEN